MTHKKPPLTAWRLAKVPAILTLIVSVARLLGEWLEWSPGLFAGQPAVVGIVWLVPLFGLWFGWRLAQNRQAPSRPGMTALAYLVGLLLGAGWMFFVMKVLVEGYGLRAGLYIGAGLWAASLIGLFAWPALFRANFVYGFAARIPVVAITLIAVPAELGTHYDQLPKEVEAGSTLDKLALLTLPQVGFWVPFTILVGGLFGSFAALMAARRYGDD
jgi:hypothetical protein